MEYIRVNGFIKTMFNLSIKDIARQVINDDIN